MSTTTSKDGTRIGYDKVGSGPLLIIIAGATQFRAFDPNLAALGNLLAPSITVITYDRRGRGESTDTLPYAPEREIEDIAALIEAGGGRASLLGYSSGAVVALEAAAAGLPIDKVIMYEPPFVLPGSNFPPPPADYRRDAGPLHRRRRRQRSSRLFHEHGRNAARSHRGSETEPDLADDEEYWSHHRL